MNIAEEVQRWGCMKQTGVNLRYMMEFGSKPTAKKLICSAQFLRNELPIRIARRIMELGSLPHGLSEKWAVLRVRDWYIDSFRELRTFPKVEDAADEEKFTQLIKAIKVRHNNVVPMMAVGVQELRKGLDPTNIYENLHEIDKFLDRFYMSRIGIRMLIGQHVELHSSELPHRVGCIHTKMSPIEVTMNACEDARSICSQVHGCSPNIDVCGDPHFTFPYVPTHLHLMVFELVKNSLRAVQEHFIDADFDIPPVRVIISEGSNDVIIKVSDNGGGIPQSCLPKIFSYLYTTSENPLDDQCTLKVDGLGTMSGYGYGLPISRLYARYFGGDLEIMSLEGCGTNAYLHLSRLGNSEEPLP